NFVGFLGILNNLIPGIGAIIITDYFIVSRLKYQDLSKIKFQIVNYNAIIAWCISFIVAQSKWGIAPINGVLSAAIIYIILSKVSGQKYVN
ncbi:MAG: cytosine permease, partial [Bacilli bacterium]